VQGYIITNQKGDIIQTTFDDKNKDGPNSKDGLNIASFIPELVLRTQSTVTNINKEVVHVHPGPTPVPENKDQQVRAAYRS